MAKRPPQLTLEEVCRAVIDDDDDSGSDCDDFADDYDFDVPMADGSDDEFEDAGEERY